MALGTAPSAGGFDCMGKFAVDAWYKMSKNTLLYACMDVANGGLTDCISQKAADQAGVGTAL